jgi:DNA-binding transcriptional ArsR family regulator
MSSPVFLDANFLKAIGHPLRAQILELIAERGEASPLELARTLEQPLATVSHHTRVLRDLQCIALVRTEPRRGAVEHYYRPAMLPFLDDEQWARLPATLRRGLSGQLFRRIFAEVSSAGGRGGFDRPGAHIDRLPLELDEQGWRDLSAALVDLLRRAQDIQEESDARHDASGSEPVASMLAILHVAAEPTDAVRGRPPRVP